MRGRRDERMRGRRDERMRGRRDERMRGRKNIRRETERISRMCVKENRILRFKGSLELVLNVLFAVLCIEWVMEVERQLKRQCYLQQTRQSVWKIVRDKEKFGSWKKRKG
ncbi:hypothetical protein TNIN_44071 [Trichonephila inaurata madagascariensis]|uniref:Uncharacterized protein n=1 Tax=Trichonephila inaurata madagascariensis TaxID=2747483 RepID=A0A8X6XTH1_9ARAC|nr:hypothetical protein TNIN_44071 [Trichonephila inaurata madagascariensis]